MESLGIILVSLAGVAIFMLGVPIMLVIGLWSIAASLLIDLRLANVSFTLFEGLNFFGLLALPLFILTGDLINAAGIAKRLTEFAYSVLGWMRGGLAMAALAACGLFAAISGSNSATAATIGSIMHPEMKENGYDGRFSAATVAAGGVVGIIIPPSIIFTVYGFIMNQSISELFIAGLVPGIMMVLAMMVAAWFFARRNKWGTIIKLDPVRIIKTGASAWLGFVAIFMILWGIYTGVFSPTEAAGVAAGFCLLSGLFITRQIKLREIPSILMKSGQIAGILGPLVAVSVVMQQVLSALGANEVVAEFITSFGGYYAVLFACMAVVFVAGMVLESLPVTLILAPILGPIALDVGIHPVHFGVVFLVGAAIGFITPPYGLNLYVASSVTGIPYLRIVPHVLPYLFALLTAWLLIALLPELSMYLVGLQRESLGLTPY